MNKKHYYSYTGPVYIFDRMVTPDCPCTTYAVSEGRAKANFEYQIKRKLGLIPSAKIRLAGKIILVV